MLFNILSTAPPTLSRFLDPALNHGDHSRWRWLGISFEYWNPCILARAGMDVLAWNENVANSLYTFESEALCVSKSGKKLRAL